MLLSCMCGICMESSEVCVDTIHVPCEDTGELCYKPHFPGKVGSKSRRNCCLYVSLVAFILIITKGDLNWKFWSVVIKQF